MTLEHVNHSHIVRFADDRINLKRDQAKKYRDQANRLTESLENYLNQHSDFSLKKTLKSGSLAKRTALSTINDIDVACYITGADSNRDANTLVNNLIKHFREAFPNFTDDQVQRQNFSVKVSFKGTGLDVDIVPILYGGDLKWYGQLLSQDDGSFLTTNIPYHLEFIRKRNKKYNPHFNQVIRLLKFWARNLKRVNPNFRFKSFMIELILAHLCDSGSNISNYPEALQTFFTYIIRSQLKEKIVFSDYCNTSKIGSFNDRIQIIDPVNIENNVAALYNEQHAQLIINAAQEAGDAIDYALYATTKSGTVQCWQTVFGTSFSG